MDWAFSVEGVPPQCVAVLIGFARHADKNGKGACPAGDTLAGYARKTRRQVLKDVNTLIEGGLIRVSDDQSPAAYIRADRRPTVYDLVMNDVSSGSQREPDSADSAGPERCEPEDTSFTEPCEPHDTSSGSQRDSDVSSGSHRESGESGHGVNHSSHEEEPSVVTSVGTSPSKDSLTPIADAIPDQKNAREDVRQLCKLLADEIEANGSKRPRITKEWQNQARLLLDTDGRDLDKALALIRWCQADEFWVGNIESMAKFRKQYDKLRLRALAEWNKRKSQEAKPKSRPRIADGNEDHWNGGGGFRSQHSGKEAS